MIIADGLAPNNNNQVFCIVFSFLVYFFHSFLPCLPVVTQAGMSESDSDHRGLMIGFFQVGHGLPRNSTH
jgi:hypothetical protein